MATVYVGLGSNIDPEINLHLGIRELRERYGELELSAVYRSKAVGFEGEDFLNLVACFESNESPVSICEEIELIHNLTGRDRDVLEYSFVLRPLAELSPDLVHPVTGKTMLKHWQEFDAASHPLDVVGVIL